MIEIEQLLFEYESASFRLSIDRFCAEQGEQIALVGPSGCGKTTVLHLLAGILSARSGTITVVDQDLAKIKDAARRRFRISNIGMVFQEFELIDYLSVMDNILLPYRINNSLKLKASTRSRARELAQSVGIEDKLKRDVNRLSQGERQRAAICRALLPQPTLLLADEPTGNLDPSNKQRIMDLLSNQARAANATLVVVTHDHSLLDGFDRVVDVEPWLATQQRNEAPAIDPMKTAGV